MAKKTKKKQKARWSFTAKQIAARERAFKALSKADQRVVIAKDVIAAVRSGALTSEKAGYFDMRGTYLVDLPGPVQLRDAILKKDAQCHVCGIGALFACKVMRVNEYTGLYASRDSIVDALNGLFSRDKLQVIEDAFEGNEGRRAMFRFWQTYEDANKRLVAIMKNIIRNNGTFVPTDIGKE